MKITQQNNKGLERYIEVECDLAVSGNTLPIDSVVQLINRDHSDISLEFLFKKILKDHFTSQDIPRLDSLAVIRTHANIEVTDAYGLGNDKLYQEYSKYAGGFNKDCAPIVLLHPSIFPGVSPQTDRLYQVDGMHRVVSAGVAGISQLPAYVIVRRVDLHKILSTDNKNQIKGSQGKCTWFPSYQEIKEVGLTGQRVQFPRYPSIYDFSILKNKTVVDFGGNTSQASVEAYYNGVKRIYSLDVQECAVETSNKIFDTLGMSNCTAHTIDFNKSSFETDVSDICPDGWDWCIFQAIYRTKEIEDIKSNFKFIADNTKEGIMFEGNGEPTIDTDEFYYKIFEPFNFKKIIPRGLCQKRPVYIIYK
jgi:hypothetical protein